MKVWKGILAIAAVVLVPAVAGAFSGNLVLCDPTPGTQSTVSFRKGLTCDETLNKLKIQVRDRDNNAIDGCDAVTGGAPWALWEENKVGGKIAAADAALIDHAEIKMRGKTFGSCNLSGSSNSAPALVSGQVAFKAANGDRIRRGKSKFVALVGADVATQSAVLNGIVTKGVGEGGRIKIQVGLDAANPVNQNILACNTGFLCPPDPFDENLEDPADPIESLALITLPSSVLRIDVQSNDACVGAGDPFQCCTGAGTGTCD